MPLTKYVSVTFTGGSNDGSTSNPYTTIEDARSDINDNLSDVGPHYIILSESSAAQTVYSASYGMPSGFEQELWVDSYDNGVIVSGAHGQDIIIDGNGATDKNAFELYGSGSGIHNMTIRNIGQHSAVGVGAILGNKRPYDIRGVTITSSFCGGITGLGDYSSTDAWTIVDSCRIHIGAGGGATPYGISFKDDSRNALINNCLIIFSGSTSKTPTRAIYAAAGGTDRATASFCTFIARVADLSHTDGNLGIRAPRVENCIVSMSLDSDANLNFPFISADNLSSPGANNLYAGFRTSIVSSGVRRKFDTTSASFDAGALTYRNTDSLTLFNGPDTTFENIFADWTLASGAPAVNAGTTTDYFGLTLIDLSGTLRADSDTGTGTATDIGAFELISLGYGNTVIGVVVDSLGKIIDVARADITKVIGVE